MQTTYQPGVCNIGLRNRLARLAAGLFFFSSGVWLWALARVNGLPLPFLLIMILPFFLGFLGIYQALFGFCAYHSRRHTFDMR